MSDPINCIHPFRHVRMFSAAAVLFALLIVLGCEDPIYRPVKKQADKDKIGFDLLVLDETGTDGSAFTEGTDIRIALIFINESLKTIKWDQEDECRVLNSKDFLLVSQLDEANVNLGSYFPVGTPYKSPVHCTATDDPPVYISGSSKVMEIPWSGNPDNKPLAPGRYYTTARFNLEIDGEQQTWDLRRDFDIY